MRTSIKKLLEREGTDRSRTVYGTVSDEIGRYVITAGDFFHLEPAENWAGNTWIEHQFRDLLEQKKEQKVYHSLSCLCAGLKEELIGIKRIDPDGYDHAEELRALRRAKKGIEEAMEDLKRCYEAEVMQKLSEDLGVGRLAVFSYKNTACVGSFADLERQIPALSVLALPWIRKTPLLLSNIKSICGSLGQGRSIGVVGGPCLFGTYEVEILVLHRDKSRYSFDFSSGRHYDGRKGGGVDFADHVERYVREIADIDFRDRKKSVTSQEYDSLEAVFAFSAALGARAAIPIPDLSYLKYLATVLTPLDREFRLSVIRRFQVHTRRIADLYLNLIEALKKKYPEVEVQVLHERNEQLCRVFHEKREPFFRKSGMIHRMTAKREKTDAVFDYISMLALPYYIWGTTQVIQVDNLDETDSYRKCRKVHKEAFALSAVLYPERLSADGRETIFNTSLEYKEYLDQDTWRRIPDGMDFADGEEEGGMRE